MSLLRRSLAALCATSLAFGAVACERRRPAPRYPQRPYQPHPGYGNQPPPQYPNQPPPRYPNQPPPNQPPPNQPPPRHPNQPPPRHPNQPPPQSHLPPVYNDPINRQDLAFMRQRSQTVLRELVAALPATQRAMVQNVPLVIHSAVGDVNAFAACIDGRALMAITDGLMQIQAQMARARATDEIFKTRKFDAYVQMIAKHQRPKQPIVQPAAGFFVPQQDNDGRKVARQHQLFDEELAFVLGHELAHHYLRHTGCVGPRPGFITPADINRVLSRAVPGFNQPNEIAADTHGTNNLLSAGKARQGYHYTEGGAMLSLNFFLALKKMTPAESVLFGFELSHPHPSFRIPIVRQTAQNWRRSGGNPQPTFPIPGLGF